MQKGQTRNNRKQDEDKETDALNLYSYFKIAGNSF